MVKNNPNTLPELPRHGREAVVRARQACSGELDILYAATMATLSRMPDVVSIISAPPRQPEQAQPTVADRILNSRPFIPQGEVEMPHMSDSQVTSAQMGTNTPEALDRFVEPRSPQERAALDQVVDAYRAAAGMPVKHSVDVDPGEVPVFPPMTDNVTPMAPAAPETPLQRVEQVFPDDEYSYDGRSLGDIRGEISDLMDGAGEE